MGKANLIQLVAWINSLTQSFEVTKWYDWSKANPQQMISDLQVISKKLYSLVVEKKNTGILNKKMHAIGMNSETLEVKPSKVKDMTKVVHYAWYEGRCLDPEKLSYVVPEKLLQKAIWQ